MDKLQQLYQKKGEAHTQIEIWQQVLQQVNQMISDEIKAKQEAQKPEVAVEEKV
jgi:hypothetical protein